MARETSTNAQEEHRQLLDDPDEFVDCGFEDDAEMHDVENNCEDVKHDPAVIAGKRSYLHALLEAKKRKQDDEAKAQQEARLLGPDDTRGPVLQGGGQDADDSLLAGVAGASDAVAAAASDGGTATAAMATLQQITGALARAASAPRPKSSARTTPYGSKGQGRG